MESDSVDIHSDVSVPDGLLNQLESAIRATLRRCDASPATTLALLLTDDQRIRELNSTYLGLDEPTDVLSFPAGEAMPGMDHLPRHLGDIVISMPYATRQAQARGHEPAAEMQLLAVHGALHLLGYDHSEPEDKRRMWRVQTEILLELGISHVNPSKASDAR